MADFSSDLSTGHRGELLLLKMCPELIRQDGRHFDFLMPSGEALELKTDTYNMDKTENFFIERWSDLHKKRPGGPYQAFGRGATIFAYLYIKNGTCFFFNTIDLIRHIDKVEKDNKIKPVYIRNHGWTTTGYKISRKDVEHLVVDIKKCPNT